uniref:Gag protein n=1 Tax=Schistocephalus solidus TaxID=70667 RepID=A0A183SC23_SCHSO
LVPLQRAKREGRSGHAGYTWATWGTPTRRLMSHQPPKIISNIRPAQAMNCDEKESKIDSEDFVSSALK